MTETNRQVVTRNLYLPVCIFLQPTVKQMIEYLEILAEEGWSEIEYDDSDDDLTLSQRRLETDEEYNRRIFWEKEAEDRAKAHRTRDRERRYQDYLKLKEEFGND